MSIKIDVLNELVKLQGKSLSGEELANLLDVSRTAVWKAVKSLRKDGYKINAVSNKGYSLSAESDVLTAENINRYLNCDDFNVTVEQKVTSTNDVAKKFAENGAKEWTVIVADEQTKGRGRYERNFYSPKGTGIYCSVILRPKYSAAETLFVTTSAAVAVCEAIEKIVGKSAKIKWVNDVFVNEKKVCGILTEASFNVESGGLTYAVLGFGINVTTEKFPKDLKDVATSVCKGAASDNVRAKLTAEVLKRFRYYYENIPKRTFYKEYKNRSMVIGKKVKVLSGNVSADALVLDIDENCFLKVKFNDGKEQLLSSGEISIKI